MARLKDHLLPQLEASADGRAKACQAALKRRPWKLDRVQEQIARGPAEHADSALASMDPPELTRIQETAEALRAARAGWRTSPAPTVIGHCRRRSCWRRRFSSMMPRDGGLPRLWNSGRPDPVLAGADRGRGAVAPAADVRGARRPGGAPARPPRGPIAEGPDLAPLLEGAAASRSACGGPASPAPTRPWRRISTSEAEAYVRAVQDAIASGRAEQDRRESEWRALSAQLAAWLDLARPAETAAGEVELLAQAEKWLKEAQAELRDQRFEPIGDAAR